jgi:hypothetical protein
MYIQPDETDPIDKLAWFISEFHNDNAPIGWEQYKSLAEILIDKFVLYDTILVRDKYMDLPDSLVLDEDNKKVRFSDEGKVELNIFDNAFYSFWDKTR